MEIQISKDSWHYKVVEFGKEEHSYMPYDSCGYVKLFLRGSLFIILSGILAAVHLVSLGELLAFCLVKVQYWESNLNPKGIAGIVALEVVLIVLISIILFCVYLIEEFETYMYQRSSNIKEPSQLGVLFRNFKDKICVKVDYVNRD